MTTPFIMWLSKSEVDEMLHILINVKSDKLLESTPVKTKNLITLSQNLITQNKNLIKLIEKIEPLNPLHKRASHIFGINQKCRHYKDELNKMSTHCSIYNTKINNKLSELHESLCKECTRKSESKHLNN